MLKPVIICIHGGSHANGSGSGTKYSSELFIQHDVIIVTFNFRLHVLGFLNLGIPECPGNASLKDQVLALKWVKENIAYFGGDPENITIYGISSGAQSAQLHTLSPLSRGLFKRVILQGGSAFTSGVLTSNPCEMAFHLGKKLGFDGKDKEKLLDFLKQKTSDQLLEAFLLMNLDRGIKNPFNPSVEIIKERAFLPDWPLKLLKIADPLPIMYGASSNEGMLIFLVPYKNYWKLIREDFSIVLKREFNIEPENSIPELAEQIKKYYFGDKEISLGTAGELTNLYTDIFLYNFYESVDNIIKYSWPVYVYQFAYVGNLNIVKKIIEKRTHRKFKGSCHSDENGYLFYEKRVENATEDDLKVINNMTTIWTNFSKSGNPCEELNWKPSTATEPSFLRIDVKPKFIKGYMYGERLEFLKKLLCPYLKSKVV